MYGSQFDAVGRNAETALIAAGDRRAAMDVRDVVRGLEILRADEAAKVVDSLADAVNSLLERAQGAERERDEANNESNAYERRISEIEEALKKHWIIRAMPTVPVEIHPELSALATTVMAEGMSIELCDTTITMGWRDPLGRVEWWLKVTAHTGSWQLQHWRRDATDVENNATTFGVRSHDDMNAAMMATRERLSRKDTTNA